MPDRQLLLEAAQLRAEIQELRSTMEQLRGRQAETVRVWEHVIAAILPGSLTL